MQICPSILESKVADYFKTLEKLSSFFNWFQLDFADGQYVKNKTASMDDFLSEIKNKQQIITNIYFDFHLMIKDFESILEKLKNLSQEKKLKIKNIFIHYDLRPDPLLFKKNFPFTIGLAINPQDEIDNLAKDYNLKSIKSIQIMSVYPGAQGSPFVPQTIKKIEQLRNLNYRSLIFLDGAVNDQTISFIKSQKFLPDVICPGSYFTKAKNNEIKKRIKNLL